METKRAAQQEAALRYQARLFLSGYAVVVPGSALPELDSLFTNALTDDVAICRLRRAVHYAAQRSSHGQ